MTEHYWQSDNPGGEMIFYDDGLVNSSSSLYPPTTHRLPYLASHMSSMTSPSVAQTQFIQPAHGPSYDVVQVPATNLWTTISLGPITEPSPDDSELLFLQQQHEAFLRSDPLIHFIEPYRVFCSVCLQWVELGGGIAYCADPWLKHRERCLMRQEKRKAQLREQQSAEGRAVNLSIQSGQSSFPVHMENFSFDTSSPCPPPRKKTKLTTRGQQLETMGALESPDAEGDIDVEWLMSLEKSRRNQVSSPKEASVVTSFAKLNTKIARQRFIAYSIIHLFSTTFESRDNLSISALVMYLNGAMPEDKHKEFEMEEVCHALSFFEKRGRVTLDGENVRLV
ncbi:hypothetical protein C8J56DRAFT_410026 [Mycena floridula]|nr:hypothetical protein C8J56DRAFT_410026 [Mycena floridula]